MHLKSEEHDVIRVRTKKKVFVMLMNKTSLIKIHDLVETMERSLRERNG